VAKILGLHAESEILNLLQLLLRRAGHEFVYTTSSDTALSILRKGDIDLFIQNLMRPDINGCELYEIMLNDDFLQHIPVLIISTINPLIYPEICSNVIHNLYPNHYLLMPFNPKEFLSMVSKILSEPIIPPTNASPVNV